MPEEIFSTQLICFNKNALCLGEIDAIRPIGVNGVISKIMEIVVRKRLRQHIYGNRTIVAEQEGFVQGLGCEVNLVVLREKVEEIIRTRTKSTKFLLFIDFQQAYDSVNHYKLFEKLENIKTPIRVIYSIKKFLSGANLKVDIVGEIIWVNQGEIQGGMLSPDLFNVI